MKKFYPTLIFSKLTQNIYFMLNNLFSDQYNNLEMNALTDDVLHAQNILDPSVHNVECPWFVHDLILSVHELSIHNLSVHEASVLFCMPRMSML